MSPLHNAPSTCPQCQTPLAPDSLSCPNCGMFVHLRELRALGAAAMELETTDPPKALVAWNRVLELLPPQSPQYRQVTERIGWLNAQPADSTRSWADRQAGTSPHARQPSAPSDSWRLWLFKTGGSLILNIPFYAYFFHRNIDGSNHLALSLIMGTGFLLMILVHEMGHVLAMRHYRLSGSPPLFIPFIGALINLRQPPRNAREEAIVGIGGPVLGTVGAAACYGLYLITGWSLLLPLAFLGFFINLFNMLPLPPLDGGRITAAISPWIWLIGLVLLVLEIIATRFQSFLPVLILFVALPRVMSTLRGRDRYLPYYRISRRASWLIATAYIGLTVVLLTFIYICNMQLRFL